MASCTQQGSSLANGSVLGCESTPMGYVHERGYVCGLNLEHGQGLVHRREACFLMKTTLLCEHDLSRARAPTEPPCSPHLTYLVSEARAPAVARSGEPLQDHRARCRHSAVRPSGKVGFIIYRWYGNGFNMRFYCIIKFSN